MEWPAVPHRNYRTGTVLPHVVGYMNEITQDELDRLNAQGEGYALGDFIGRRGVERYFERRLRGKDGSRKEVVNARGETIQELSELITGAATVASTPGDNVVLSIDMRLQAEAEKAFPGTAGAVVAMDVRTGLHPGDGVPARVRPERAHRPGDADPAPGPEQGPAPADDLPPGAAALQPRVDLQAAEHVRRAVEQELHPAQHRELRRRVPSGCSAVALPQGCGPRPGGRPARTAAVVRHLVLQGGGHARPGPHRGDGPELRARRAHRRRGGGRGAGHHARQRLPRPGHPGRLHQGHGAQQRHRPGRRERDAAAAHHGLRRGGQRRPPLPAAAGAPARDAGRPDAAGVPARDDPGAGPRPRRAPAGRGRARLGGERAGRNGVPGRGCRTCGWPARPGRRR